MEKKGNAGNSSCQVLLVCKPSGRNSFYVVSLLVVSIIGSIVFGYQSLSNPNRWWACLFFIVIGVLCFFVARSEFFGEEHLCVDGNDFVVHYVRMFPFRRDKRIPLSEIADIRYNQKSKMQEISDALDEFYGHAVEERGILLVTKSGKGHLLGEDLTKRQVEKFIHQLEEYIKVAGGEIKRFER